MKETKERALLKSVKNALFRFDDRLAMLSIEKKKTELEMAREYLKLRLDIDKVAETIESFLVISSTLPKQKHYK